MSTHDATFYVQIEPDIYSTNYSSPSVRKIQAARLTQKRPHDPIGGAVMVKLTLRLPDSVFLPLRPEAVIVVPESLTEGTPLEVEVMQP